jgi:small redox-active disulfide protein 2
MKDIKVLGPGCARCEKLKEVTTDAANELGIEYELTKITDIMEISGFGVMMTPALVVDGTVRVSGKVPSKEEIKEMLK